MLDVHKVMNLSFFAKHSYSHSADGHLMRGSSIIRAQQIAEYLGAKLNPIDNYQDDICIYVKPADNIRSVLEKLRKVYIDMIDNKGYRQWLQENPGLRGIVASQYSFDFLRKTNLRNQIVFIPQQHCNFENIRRERKEINTVGIIGSPKAFQYPIEDVRERLKNIGLDLVVNTDFQTRENVINFYKSIDIQLIWQTKYRLFKNPLKIINAASFGIPTVGYPHKGYKEVEGYYHKVFNMDQLIEEVGKLKDESQYEAATKELVSMAEKYHISIIADMYKNLGQK